MEVNNPMSNMTPNINHILIDMDEVLVHFVEGWCKCKSMDLDSIESIWQKWNQGCDVGISNFWEGIDGDESFWVNLRATDWAHDLINLIDKHEWYIVTSPSNCPTSYSGKARWLKNFFGNGFNRFFPCCHKHVLANPTTLLIDDREYNCTDFAKHGGRTLLFPAWYNYKKCYTGKEIEYVAFTLNEILSGRPF